MYLSDIYTISIKSRGTAGRFRCPAGFRFGRHAHRLCKLLDSLSTNRRYFRVAYNYEAGPDAQKKDRGFGESMTDDRDFASP